MFPNWLGEIIPESRTVALAAKYILIPNYCNTVTYQTVMTIGDQKNNWKVHDQSKFGKSRVILK